MSATDGVWNEPNASYPFFALVLIGRLDAAPVERTNTGTKPWILLPTCLAASMAIKVEVAKLNHTACIIHNPHRIKSDFF